MSDETKSTDSFQLRQFANETITHYISTSVERNSKGFTTTLKATIGLPDTTESKLDEVALIQRMREVNNLCLAAGQLNIEYRKMLIAMAESKATHEEAVAIAEADFKQFMEAYTQPAGE